MESNIAYKLTLNQIGFNLNEYFIDKNAKIEF